MNRAYSILAVKAVEDDKRAGEPRDLWVMS